MPPQSPYVDLERILRREWALAPTTPIYYRPRPAPPAPWRRWRHRIGSTTGLIRWQRTRRDQWVRAWFALEEGANQVGVLLHTAARLRHHI